MEPRDLIDQYYPRGTKGHDILLRHSEKVADKAVRVAQRVTQLLPDIDFVHEAAMLHDIAIFMTRAPAIGCYGSHPYVVHGYLGRRLLEEHGLPRHALVCERHVGVGLTVADIRDHQLPLPFREMLPISVEEKIVCYADKFFSKNAEDLCPEKTLDEVLKSLEKYGKDKVARFSAWHADFNP